MTSSSHLQERQPPGVKSAGRALVIVELVSQRDGITLSEVSDALSLPRSSCHGLLKTLVAADWLRVSDGRYRLGVRAWLVGRSAAAFDGAINRVRKILEELTNVTGETAQFATLHSNMCVYLAISESPHPMRLFTKEGSKLHPHATAVGRAMLSVLAPEQRAEILADLDLVQLTNRTVTDRTVLARTIDQTAADGYATEVGEYVDESTCVAAPVGTIDEIGLTCALAITTPVYRRPDEWPHSFLPPLRAAVREAKDALAASPL